LELPTPPPEYRFFEVRRPSEAECDEARRIVEWANRHQPHPTHLHVPGEVTAPAPQIIHPTGIPSAEAFGGATLS
jgi:hypothetical protein